MIGDCCQICVNRNLFPSNPQHAVIDRLIEFAQLKPRLGKGIAWVSTEWEKFGFRSILEKLRTWLNPDYRTSKVMDEGAVKDALRNSSNLCRELADNYFNGRSRGSLHHHLGIQLPLNDWAFEALGM